jgi:hypothetical protein
MTKPGVARPKVREPQRTQSSFRIEIPEDLLPPEHPARLLWNVLGTLDLSAFLADTRTAQHCAGRSELSPRMKGDRHHGKVASGTSLPTADLTARSARRTPLPSLGPSMGARGGSRSWVALLATALMFVPLDASAGDPMPAHRSRRTRARRGG